MTSPAKTIPIPIEVGKEIAEVYRYDQVVIVARKVGDCEHVTTYGVDPAHCDVAARMGNFFKHKLMGWPEHGQTPAYDALAGLFGLVQLVLGRDDLPDDLRDALSTNHRVMEAQRVLNVSLSGCEPLPKVLGGT